MTAESPPSTARRSLLAGRLARVLAVLLFLVIGWLTIPKLAPRMMRIFSQREGRASIIRQQAADAGIVLSEDVRSGDLWLIVGAVACGAALLGGLSYIALRPTAHPLDEASPGDISAQEAAGTAAERVASRKKLS